MSQVRWERMFPDQLEEAFANCPVVYFAYGLCEPHGPQNAVGLDALKAHGIACKSAEAHGGIVAPPDYWHVHELGGYAIWAESSVGDVDRSWLTCMPPWQHFKNVLYHIRQADRLGFHAAIFITGHYGPNWQDLKTLLELVQPSVGTRLYGLPDFEANFPGFDNDNKSGGDHAGRVETSLLWAVEPSCVDVSRIPTESGQHFAMGGNASESNRKTGERMVADEVEWLGEKSRELLAQYDADKPDHTLLTFEDVEQLWESTIAPEVKNFHSMVEVREGQSAPPERSYWNVNHRVPERDGRG